MDIFTDLVSTGLDTISSDLNPSITDQQTVAPATPANTTFPGNPGFLGPGSSTTPLKQTPPPIFSPGVKWALIAVGAVLVVTAIVVIARK